MKPLSTVVALAFACTPVADARPGDEPVPPAVTGHVATFESAEPGAFDELATPVGTWTSNVGRAIVDRAHAKTGRQCLQLTGGERTSVTLELADGVDTSGVLSFWAERWTVRKPFSFRIEKGTRDGWTEIFDGDATVRVGRAFLNHVKVPLGDAGIERLRFTCTSPPNTGILIDDLRIAPARPQRIKSVEVVPVTLPALVGTAASPLVKLHVVTEGSLEPISLASLRATSIGDGVDFSRLHVHVGPWAARYAESPWQAGNADAGAKRYDAPVDGPGLVLQEGENTVWIAARVKEDANVDGRVGLRLREVGFSNGRSFELDASPSAQRLGVAVRRGGDDEVHTYRIPGLATTNEGTLIGVYDVRRRGGGDLPGDIDVGLSRSTDGGRTWEPMKVVMDMGDDPEWRYDGIGDPAVLVDRGTGTIWVAATWSHGNRSWRGSGPGLKPEETGQLMLVRSDDDGVTWSKPINVTSQVKRPEWCFLLQGPGKGITMRDGTIVFAAQYQDPPEKNRLPHSTILSSRDHGKTWHVGTGAFDDTTEAQVVEVEPGVLMLNCRYNRKSARVVMVTRDMGRTWERHATSERALIEPRACMASLIDVDREVGEDVGGWLLFSNPDSLSGRNHITIKASPDGGRTWPKEHRLLLDEGNSAGYSCLSMIDAETVGILYEGSRAHMTFQRIPLSDVVGEPKPSPDEPPGERTSLSLPRVFGDHMVLQADSAIPIRGWATPGARVDVRLGEDRRSTAADNDGRWSVRLAARNATATPSTLVVRSGDDRIACDDVLVGEVWVCAGQSNMEWPVAKTDVQNDDTKAIADTGVRLLHLEGGARGSSGSFGPSHLARLTPEAYCEGEWAVATPETVGRFSAVGWSFGRALQRELKVPIGLICPAAGGTPTEAWIPREALATDPELRGLVAGHWLDNPRLGEFCRTRGDQNLRAAIQGGEDVPGDDLGPNHPFKPGFMWEAGVEPLLPYAIRGVVWYQGESNAETRDRVREHRRLFTTLVDEWRRGWKQRDLPVLFVQLPALNRPEWPWFREGQRRLLDDVENVGMAVTIDTGHPTNVHPAAKRVVGERLARWALADTYDRESHEPRSGPLPNDVRRRGASMVVAFEHTGEGLKSIDGKSIRHFEIRGDDGVFHAASARIVDGRTVSVSSPKVPEPTHMRYGWAPFPEPPVNLVNSAGLPASPFSTESDEQLFATDERPLASRPDPKLDARPNILLIVGEDHGCELSCYGDPVIRTPHIDRLAAEGVLFENGYVTQSVCSPSRSTIFTGLYPHQNGQLGLATHGYRWFRDWPTTYSLLKRAGYRTGLIGKTHVLPAEAVERHVDLRFQKSSNFSKRNVAEYAVRAGEFFRAGDEPFFLTVNYPDAHWPLQGEVDGLPTTRVDPERVRIMPYVGVETPRLRAVARNYYDCMLRLDECVGRLLGELDESVKSRETLVVFIGDHGAQMARGKVTVYEGGMRVPFLVRWPGVARAEHRSRALVSTIDLLPTFLDAAGVQFPSGLPGRSLRPALTGEVDAEFREYLACERNCDAARHTFPQRTIRDARYKLIHSPVRDREDPAARYYREHGASHWAGCPTAEELAGASPRVRAGYARWLTPPEYQLYDLSVDPTSGTT